MLIELNQNENWKRMSSRLLTSPSLQLPSHGTFLFASFLVISTHATSLSDMARIAIPLIEKHCQFLPINGSLLIRWEHRHLSSPVPSHHRNRTTIKNRTPNTTITVSPALNQHCWDLSWWVVMSSPSWSIASLTLSFDHHREPRIQPPHRHREPHTNHHLRRHCSVPRPVPNHTINVRSHRTRQYFGLDSEKVMKGDLPEVNRRSPTVHNGECCKVKGGRGS